MLNARKLSRASSSASVNQHSKLNWSSKAMGPGQLTQGQCLTRIHGLT